MAIVAEYFGIFGDGWNTRFREDTPFDMLTRLNVSFGKIIQANGHFSLGIDGSDERFKELVGRVKAVNPGAEIFITVGGNGDQDSYGGACKDALFAENVAVFLDQHGLNGFDIDWEYGLYEEGVNALTANLSSELKPKGYLLTLDGWPGGSAAYDFTHLKKTLNQINIMSYGAECPLKPCVKAYKGFPKDQLIGGIDTELDCPGGPDTLGDDGTIAEKAHYARKKKLAGVMAWRMDNDYAEKPNCPTYQGAVQLWSSMGLSGKLH